jgi:signal transduction histidine kinase
MSCRIFGHAIMTSNATTTVETLPCGQGNEKHLLRVFQNLISNAIEYRGDAPLEIRVTAKRLESNWVVKVQDNGVDIAPEHHERVFRLLKRLHGPETPGAGIGLAICKKIIEAAGGKIRVESNPGAGSTFYFTVTALLDAGYCAANPDKPSGEWNLVSTSSCRLQTKGDVLGS